MKLSDIVGALASREVEVAGQTLTVHALSGEEEFAIRAAFARPEPPSLWGKRNGERVQVGDDPSDPTYRAATSAYLWQVMCAFVAAGLRAEGYPCEPAKVAEWARAASQEVARCLPAGTINRLYETLSELSDPISRMDAAGKA